MADRIALKQRIARILSRSDEVLATLPVPLTTTVLGTTTTVRDTTLARGTTQAERYNHRHVEIIELVTSGPAIGEVAVVDNAGFDNTDQLTVSPAFSNPVQTGTDYILWPKGLSPDLVEQHMNDVLRATYHPHLWIPSLVGDPHFEEDDLAKWPAVGTPTTRDFITTVPFLGERSLRLVTDEVGEGASSQTFPVTEREQLLLACFIRTDLGSAIVTLRNSTASSDIRSVTVDEELYTEVRFVEAVEDDMHAARVRFTSGVASSAFYVAPPVIVQSFAGRAYPVPSWLVNPKTQIREALYLRQGFASEVDKSFIALSRASTPAPVPPALRSDRWVVPSRVELRASSQGPIAFVCHRPFAELSSDTATTGADEDYIAYATVGRILRDRGDGAYRTWRDAAREIAVARGYGERSFVVEENRKVLVR